MIGKNTGDELTKHPHPDESISIWKLRCASAEAQQELAEAEYAKMEAHMTERLEDVERALSAAHGDCDRILEKGIAAEAALREADAKIAELTRLIEDYESGHTHARAQITLLKARIRAISDYCNIDAATRRRAYATIKKGPRK